MMGEIVARNM